MASQIYNNSFFNTQDKTIQGLTRRIEALESALENYKKAIEFSTDKRSVLFEKTNSSYCSFDLGQTTNGLYHLIFEVSENFPFINFEGNIVIMNDLFYGNNLFLSKGSPVTYYSKINSSYHFNTPLADKEKKFEVVVDLRFVHTNFDHNELKTIIQGMDSRTCKLLLTYTKSSNYKL
jgi:hypothetical protein